MDSSGGISFDELSQGLEEQGYVVSPNEVERLMSRLDLDADGHVVFDEFAAGLIDWKDVSPPLPFLKTYEDCRIRVCMFRNFCEILCLGANPKK